METRHPEHDAEQAYIIEARRALDASVAHVEVLLAAAKTDRHNPDAQALAANLTGRVQRLRDAGAQAACFARLDDEDDETFYIGRQHIADEDQNALVIDWRARAAEPFYRATALHPMGVELRRQFVLEGDALVEIYDTDLTDPDAAAGIPDPLLAEINRARTGSMREIVATIQAEQDRIVRAPLERTLVVQGGPGTGKTAVGLHRAAYLLFEHRDLLSREGVLVVGPNRRFLDYIADVLPSLGERSSRQVVPADLGDIELPADDGLGLDHRRLAGDPRMVPLIRRHLERGLTEPAEDIRVRTDAGSATLQASAARAHMADVRREFDRIGPARETWMSRMISDLRDDIRSRSTGGPTVTASDFGRAVRKSTAFREFVKAHWPESKPQPAIKALWRDTVRDEALLRDVGFDADEVTVLQSRPPRRALSEVDRPLIDEASFQLGQRFVDYGHVILDEAQDLSPMALRMVARRAKGQSFTILGDVAQCSGHWMYDDWDLPLASLGTADAPVELAELTVGYRVPDEFIALANAVLPEIGDALRPTTSVRPAARRPTWAHVPEPDLVDMAVERALEADARWATVAVVDADPDRRATMTERLGDAATVDVLSPLEAKGLEFDGVIVVEPAAMHEPFRSWRPLFVAVTRAVQHLELIGCRPLPDQLATLVDAE